MADLRAAFEGGGFDAVETYIQSGNVLFESPEPVETLEPRIEQLLEQLTGAPIVTVVRSRARLRDVVEWAPEGFGTRPDLFLSDVLFLKAPLTAEQVLRVVEPRDGVDEMFAGADVVYVQRSSAERSRSRLARIVSTPEYARITVRNWATTTKLLALLDDRTR